MHIKKLVLTIALFSLAVPVAAQSSPHLRPVSTYSIVAYDPVTGQLGAAVQSHWFKAADVIWAEPGVGVVATQSLAKLAFGPRGLEMMKAGKTAHEALAGMLAVDSQDAVRQVAMIDADGNIATHTGGRCIAYAGHHTGPNYSVQANLMHDSTVWAVMAAAFESTAGELAEKMLAALEAAEAEGGDLRVKQSAAMLVVRAESSGERWADKLVDIRVDDSPEPLPELRRLLNLTRAYDLTNFADELLAEKKFRQAAGAYLAATKLAPGKPEILFWYAVTLAAMDEVDRSLPLFTEVFSRDVSWRDVVPRLFSAELLPDDPAIYKKIMAQ